MGTPSAWLLAVAFAAGCVGGPADDAATDASPGDGPPAATPWVLTWQGHIVADVALGVPAHVDETSEAYEAVAAEGFHLRVDEAPSDMQVTLSWTAPAAALLLMVSLPMEGWPPVEYSNPPDGSEPTAQFVDRPPICSRIPADVLVPGDWMIMVHPREAVDADLVIEVVLTGGAATVVEEPADVPAAVLPQAAKDKISLAPLPCESA